MRSTKTALLAAALLGLASTALATPYASGIADLGGGNYSFILNQDLDAGESIVIDRIGQSAVTIPGPLARGTHPFSATSGYNSIAVSSTAAAGWTQYSNGADSQMQFYLPRGIAVNRNPGSPNFGRVYVSNGSSGTTTSGRTLGEGLYGMTADTATLHGPGQEDTAFTGGVDWVSGGSSSPFRLMVGPDDGVYVTDWSDGHSGLWRASAGLGGTYPNVLSNANRDAGGLCDNHGSIPGVYVEGTGADTRVYTLDEDFDAGNGPGSVLRYDVGTATDYNGAPVEQTWDVPNIILNMRADLARAEDGSWWVSQYRFTESTGAPSLTRWTDGGDVSDPIFNSADLQDYDSDDVDDFVLDLAYGSIDTHHGLDLLIMGRRSGGGVFVIDVSDPDAPVLMDVISAPGFTQDVAFDAAGNLYLVNSSSETLQMWEQGGDWVATTFADGTFSVVPEPAALVLLALGGVALLRRR